MPTRAAIYTRISKHNDKIPKVADQEAMCRKLAKQHELEIVQVYEDDGISASSGANRPGWNDLLRDVQTGKIDVLIAQSEDRFTRQTMEKETLILTCAAAGVTWLTINDGKTDPATADGQFFASMRGALARMETARKSERQRQGNDESRRRGEVQRGGDRPFGWMDDKRTVHPVEGPLVVQAYDDYLGGRGLSSIRREWNEGQYWTSRGKPWDIAKLEKVLRRPRNAGLVQVRGEILPGVRGEWEPLVSHEVWTAAVEMLNSPARKINKAYEARWLMSSLARCAACDGPLRASARNGGEMAYRCASERGAVRRVPGVRHVSVRTHLLDETVIDSVVSAIIMAPTSGVPDADVGTLKDLHLDLAGVAQQEANLLELIGDVNFNAAALKAKQADLTVKRDKIQTAIADVAARNARASLIAEAHASLWSGNNVSLTDAAKAKAQVREQFDALSLEQRRALVKGMVSVMVGSGRTAKRIKITHLVATGLN